MEIREIPKRAPDPITSYELWRIPEFKALCDRIGIEYFLPIGATGEIGMIIDIPADPNKLVTITQQYQARPGYKDYVKAAYEKANKPTEITTQANDNFRTYTPDKAPDDTPR